MGKKHKIKIREIELGPNEEVSQHESARDSDKVVDIDGDFPTKIVVRRIFRDVEVGTIYEGKVLKVTDFGAFVNILPGKDGLVHISQISEERVQNVADELSEGQTVKVKVLEVNKQGRIRLSIKAVAESELS